MPPKSETMQMERLNFAQAINIALREEMRRDPRVIVMGIGVNYSSAFRGLNAEFGNDRLIETPIAEQGFTCAGIGAAMMGFRPVVAIGVGDFLYCAMDSIANEAAKYRYICGGGEFRVPMVVKVQATGMGAGAGSQHTHSVEATFMHLPGLKIAFPSSPSDAFGLFRSAVRDNNPVLFFEHRQLKKSTDTEDITLDPNFVVPFGQANIKRTGKDISIVTYGYMVRKCVAAATELATRGIDAEVIDLRTLLPWDKETVLSSAARTSRVLVVSEDCKTGGAGAEILATIAEESSMSRTTLHRLCYPDMIVPNTHYGERLFMIEVNDIIERVSRMV